jgi:hypothetical protein
MYITATTKAATTIIIEVVIAVTEVAMASEQEDKSKVGFFNTIHWLTHLLLITCCSQIFHLCYIFFKYRHVDGKEKGVEFIST